MPGYQLDHLRHAAWLAVEGPAARLPIEATHLKAHRTVASLDKKGLLHRSNGRIKDDSTPAFGGDG